MKNKKVSGFDMGPTIQWYEANLEMFTARLPMPVQYFAGPPRFYLEDPHGLHVLTLADIQGVLAVFPLKARNRMLINKITFDRSVWFTQASTKEKPVPTLDIAKAISATAIAPSKVDVENLPPRFWSRFRMNPVLFQIQDLVAPEIRRIIHLEGLAHELAHSIVNVEMWNSDNCRLVSDQVGNKSIFEFISEAEAAINSAPPISHYAGAYFDPVTGQLPPNSLVGIAESLAEAIAAYLLGFAFRTDGDGLSPFVGRDSLYEIVKWYLNAERVLTTE